MLDKSTLSASNKKNFTAEEILKFDRLAENWWDPNGKYKTALEFNRARVEYFIERICEHFGRNKQGTKPLEGLRILDVGCGGGLVCEPLAKAGAQVTGIDVSETSIEVAKRHANKNGLVINYVHQQASDALSTGVTYDVVINAEVIEHVPDQKALVKTCSQLCEVGGCVVLATLNRTIKSFLVGIVGAEYIMRYLPIGTHSWHLFVTPFELNSMASIVRLKLLDEKGMSFNLFSKKWRVVKSMQVNYVQIYEKLPSLYD